MHQKHACIVCLKSQYAVQIKHSSFSSVDFILWQLKIVFALKLSEPSSYFNILIIDMGFGWGP